MLASKLESTERVKVLSTTDDQLGEIRWNPQKSLFFFAMTVTGLLALPYTNTKEWLIFTGLSGLTIMAGHSVGMHRLLIHKSFKTAKWVEHTLVYLGVLVGMAGPFGMIRLHDMRDWHQRQSQCPAYPSHSAGFWKDAWWQLHCSYHLQHPPEFVLEYTVANDRYYQWLERTWMWQQLPLAVVLFAVGGWSLVGLGVGFRVFVSLTGHWVVGHYAHRTGKQRWVIGSLPVQGYNLPYLSWLAFGENWHGNHHAFPESAKMGVETGQSDPGFQLIQGLEKLGLVWDVNLPEHCIPREGLVRLH